MGAWTRTKDGWCADASDLKAEFDATGRIPNDPDGKPMNLRGPEWTPQADAEGEVVSWRRQVPNGSILTVFNAEAHWRAVARTVQPLVGGSSDG